MSAATVNGSEAGKGGANKQQFKSGNGPGNGKALDGIRKSAASPVDGQARKQSSTPPPKAWQGVNPITQRASTPSNANGGDKSHVKSTSHAPPPGHAPVKAAADGHGDKHAHDRALYLLAIFTGHDATLTLKNGEQFRGIFSGASFDSPSKLQYVLKMVKRTSPPRSRDQVNGAVQSPDEYIGDGEDHVMVFDKEDTVDLSVPDVKPITARDVQNGSIGSSFRTDTQISGHAALPRERELQRWVAGPSDPTMEIGLEDSNEGGWDQFSTNERLYGVQSTYDENLYTTAIDRSDPLYRQREAEAARIAREIEGSAPADAHVAEERQRDAEAGGDGADEEEKYSGVRRESALPKRAAGAYIPPSQRPITTTPTVAGAPYDPAIISSQLARPILPAVNDAVVDSPTPSATPIPQVQSTGLKAQATSQTTRPTPAEKVSEKGTEDTADGYMRGVTDSFKQFAIIEKSRVRQAQEAKRLTQRAEKNVRLNDLKKFSENFKLKSRVPDDLVPILAKDREKQVEIQTKAEQAAKDEEIRAKEKEKEKEKATGPSPSIPTAPQASVSPAAAVDPRVNGHRPRQSQNLAGATLPPGPLPNMRRNGGPSPTPPTGRFDKNRIPIEPLPSNLRDLHKPPVPPQQPEGPFSPTTSQKLNVKATTFEFRPGAHSFNPAGASPSPQRLPSRAPPTAPQPGKFFSSKRSGESQQGKGTAPGYSPLIGVKAGAQTEDQKKTFVPNGGVQKAYSTPPTWRVPDDAVNSNTTFKDALPKQHSSQSVQPHLPAMSMNHMAHGHQLQPHFSQPQMQMPPQGRHFMGPPHHGHNPGNFDPSRMQHFGPNGSSNNSPRFSSMPMAFGNQMPAMQPYGGQQMPFPGMSPSMQMRQIQQPNGQGMGMTQVQGQMPPMPQGPYPRMPGPYQPPMMGGVPMVNQASSGFPGGPMPPQGGYSPMPPHAQPHMTHNMPNGPGQAGGYVPTSRPGSHMMQHTGSHHSFPSSPMPPHMAPSYSAGPGQQHPYHPQQQQRFPQMTPRQQAAIPQHGSPGMGMAGADEAK